MANPTGRSNSVVGLLTSLGLAVPALGGVGCSVSNPPVMRMDAGRPDAGPRDAGSLPDSIAIENPGPDTGPLGLPDVPPDPPDASDDADVVDDADASAADAATDDTGSDGDAGSSG